MDTNHEAALHKAHQHLAVAYVGKGDRKGALVEYEWLKTRWPRDADVVLAETKKYPAK